VRDPFVRILVQSLVLVALALATMYAVECALR
jgi:hypothetical protein